MPSPCVPPVPPALFMRLHPTCMPPIRTGNETDDDQRVLEVQHAPQVVNYTFLNQRSPPPTDMEPIDFIFPSAHDDAAPTTPQRTSHGKRRDASYIPRPPNAFILFRSSFIRDQKVTNKVEGNHSNLSKIIGMYWKTLTKEQRDEWEAKAAQALVEHRKRYPDWRFSPATNAGTNGKSKIRITDGVRRARPRKDPPDRGGGGGEEESEEGPRRGRTMTRAADEESRLTKIAGLLVEGQEGEALERAVKEWEAGRRRSTSISTSASSSPVVTCASASASIESTRALPVITPAYASSAMNPEPPATSASLPSRELSAPVMTRASSMKRGPSTLVSAPSDSCVDTVFTSKDVLAPSLPITPRLPTSPSTPLRLVTIFRPTPSWPTSPITPPTPSTPVHWPASPVDSRVSTSFPTFTSAEDWESGNKMARTTSTSVCSPIITPASVPMTNGQVSILAPAPCIYTTSTRRDAHSSSSPSTPRQLMSASTPTLPKSVPIPKLPPPASWPASPIIPQTLGSTLSASTPGPLSMPVTIPRPSPSWPVSPVTPQVLASTPSTPVHWPTSPIAPRISVSPSKDVLAPSLPIASRLPTSPSTPLRSATISRPPPLLSASPITPQALASTPSTPVHWPTSPVAPGISASFPSFTPAEEWEVGYKIARSTSISMSELAASSPIVTRASAAATDSEPTVLDQSMSVSASALGSPSIMTRPPASTPSWPASPATRTHVPNPSWSTMPNSPATLSHVPTSASSRRPRSRSRSPTYKSPQSPSASMSTKRSLSAPAPRRDYHRQQEPVRTDAGFWWPAPEEREYSHEQEPQAMGIAMEMGIEIAEPTREGSFDPFSAQDQETEHESVIRSGDTNEWAWRWSGFDADSKSTSIHSSISFSDQTSLSSTSTDPQSQLELTPHERWFNPWDADTAIHAGDSIHPLPPTPISPLSSSFTASTHTHTTTPPTRSSFSSLAGWDGTNTESATDNVGGGCVPVKASGIGAMVWGGNGLQRLGVQGGGGESCQWRE